MSTNTEKGLDLEDILGLKFYPATRVRGTNVNVRNQNKQRLQVTVQFGDEDSIPENIRNQFAIYTIGSDKALEDLQKNGVKKTGKKGEEDTVILKVPAPDNFGEKPDGLKPNFVAY